MQGLKNDVILSLGGNLSVKESAALIEKCAVFISNDTGPMHIAAALNVPLVAVFGSTNPLWTGPIGSRSRVLYRKVPCSPCFKRSCPRKSGRYECLSSITADNVIREIEKLKVL